MTWRKFLRSLDRLPLFEAIMWYFLLGVWPYIGALFEIFFVESFSLGASTPSG